MGTLEVKIQVDFTILRKVAIPFDKITGMLLVQAYFFTSGLERFGSKTVSTKTNPVQMYTYAWINWGKESVFCILCSLFYISNLIKMVDISKPR